MGAHTALPCVRFQAVQRPSPSSASGYETALGRPRTGRHPSASETDCGRTRRVRAGQLFRHPDCGTIIEVTLAEERPGNTAEIVKVQRVCLTQIVLTDEYVVSG